MSTIAARLPQVFTPKAAGRPASGPAQASAESGQTDGFSPSSASEGVARPSFGRQLDGMWAGAKQGAQVGLSCGLFLGLACGAGGGGLLALVAVPAITIPLLTIAAGVDGFLHPDRMLEETRPSQPNPESLRLARSRDAWTGGASY